MSISRKKISYKCDCGIDSGDCDRENIFILETCTTSDLLKLYHKRHGEKFKQIISFGDSAHIALMKLFSTNVNSKTINLDEIEVIKDENKTIPFNSSNAPYQLRHNLYLLEELDRKLND